MAARRLQTEEDDNNKQIENLKWEIRYKKVEIMRDCMAIIVYILVGCTIILWWWKGGP